LDATQGPVVLKVFIGGLVIIVTRKLSNIAKLQGKNLIGQRENFVLDEVRRSAKLSLSQNTLL
jgi:hypothetical protein